jgi:hypothetical protein
MARVIELQKAATCSDCGASLAIGDRARFYGRNRIYGVDCHEVDWNAVRGEKSAGESRLLGAAVEVLYAVDTPGEPWLDALTALRDAVEVLLPVTAPRH